MPYLEHDGVTRELPQGETLVGSGSEVDWRLQTINLAPRHFTVHVDGAGVAVLTPCRSRDVDVNGTTITEPRALTSGDEIIAGAGIFSFLQSLEAQAPAPSAPPAAAFLIDIGAGHAYPLTDDALTIGRDPLNQITVRDASVSRFHAEVRSTPDRRAFAIRSMGAGGTSINGVLVGGSPRPLAEGDLVRIGGTTLRFTTVPPSPMLRIVARGDVPAGPRARQSGGGGGGMPRAVEAPTLGAQDPLPVPGSGRSSWITAALVLTAALLAALILRAVHSH